MERLSLQTVFHPSDFTPGDEGAFAHALKVALAAKAELNIFHANSDEDDVDWDDFPSVRRTLEKWGMLPEGGTKEDVRRLGLDVHKVKRTGNDPVKTILHYLRKRETDLIVLSTRQRRGVSRWMNPSVAEPVARQSRVMTLFVPRRTVGFVSLESGALRLEQVVVPVDRVPDPQQAINAAMTLAGVLGVSRLHFTLLHVGAEDRSPEVEAPDREGWTAEKKCLAGDVVDQVLRVSEELDADLIAMATAGRDGFLDALRGSTTEQVVRQARCPVLAIPANS